MPFEKSKKELRARENAAGILGKYVDRCWNDLAFFLSHECMVKASPMSGAAPGTLMRLKVNAPQRRKCGLIDRQRAAGGPISTIDLKARKWGGTAVNEGALVREMVLMGNTSALTIAHTRPTAVEITAMADMMLANLDITKEMGERITRASRKLRNGSRMDVQTAGAKEAPSFGFAFDVALLSEFAQIKSAAAAQRVWTGVRNASVAARLFIVESQARGRGGLFWDFWQDAMTEEQWFSVPKSERRMCRFFAPFQECEWYRSEVDEDLLARLEELKADDRLDQALRENLLFDDYEEELCGKFGLDLGQIAWRRWAVKELCGGDPETFREQYPTDEETAFLVGGRPAIPLQALEMRRNGIKEPISRGTVRDGSYREGEGECNVWLWEDPEEGQDYVLGGDTAQGDPEGEPSALELVHRKTKRQCAEFLGCARPITLAKMADVLGRMYNGATVVSERDGINMAFLEPLSEVLEYPDVYRHVDSEASLHAADGVKIGIKTTPRMREILVDRGRSAAADPHIAVFSERLVDQLCTLAYDSHGRVRHTSGTHDDAFRAWCNALYVCDEESVHVTEPVVVAPKETRPKHMIVTLDDLDGPGVDMDETLGTCW